MGRKNKKPQVRRRNGWGAPPQDRDVSSDWEGQFGEPPAVDAPPAAEVEADEWQVQVADPEPYVRATKKWPRRRDCSHFTLCCDVPTGFEREAGDEINEVFGRQSSFERRMGLVCVGVRSLDEVHKVHVLRSADRMYVEACDLRDHLPRDDADMIQALECVQEAAGWVSWDTALEVWAEASGVYHGSPSNFPEEYEARPPSFRVECEISPTSRRQRFGTADAKEYFTVGVAAHFGWLSKDSTSCDLVVGLVICDRDIKVVIELKRNRSADALPGPFGGLGLPPTLAHVLLRVAKIRPGEVVVDPMCGSCAIGIEGAFGWPSAWHISGDTYIHPMHNTQRRVDRLDAAIQMDNVEWNSKRLPLRDASVDAIVTDLPCGQQLHKPHLLMYTWGLYPAALKEFARIIRPGGRLVLLTQDVKPLQAAIQKCRMWIERKSWQVMCRGLSSRVFVLDIDVNWKYVRPASERVSKKIALGGGRLAQKSGLKEAPAKHHGPKWSKADQLVSGRKTEEVRGETALVRPVERIANPSPSVGKVGSCRQEQVKTMEERKPVKKKMVMAMDTSVRESKKAGQNVNEMVGTTDESKAKNEDEVDVALSRYYSKLRRFGNNECLKKPERKIDDKIVERIS